MLESGIGMLMTLKVKFTSFNANVMVIFAEAYLPGDEFVRACRDRCELNRFFCIARK
jgi:hypothetical protein